jgi:hypothetical protein
MVCHTALTKRQRRAEEVKIREGMSFVEAEDVGGGCGVRSSLV